MEIVRLVEETSIVIAAIVSGTLLGLSCGLAPGPLLTLVLAQALRHGPREGVKVAFVPLITDAPIIWLAVMLAARAAELQRVMGGLSIAGGVFVFYLAIDTVRTPADILDSNVVRPKSWTKGILTNLLSPNPWLFWMTVGAATLAQTINVGWLASATFLGVFYTWLVGIKLTVALVAGRSRDFLQGRIYHGIMWVLAVLLALFAILLLQDGIQRLF